MAMQMLLMDTADLSEQRSRFKLIRCLCKITSFVQWHSSSILGYPQFAPHRVHFTSERSERVNRFRIGIVGRGGETVDALRSGRSVRKDVRVRLPPSAPNFPISGITG